MTTQTAHHDAKARAAAHFCAEQDEAFRAYDLAFQTMGKAPALEAYEATMERVERECAAILAGATSNH